MNNNRDIEVDISTSVEQTATTLAVRQVTAVLCGAGNTVGLNGKAVTLYGSGGTSAAYFFDVNSSGVAAPVGPTLTYRVSVLSTDLNTAVATKLSSAMASNAMFTETVAGATVNITNAVAGAVTAPTSTLPAGFTVTVTTPGVNAIYPAPPAVPATNHVKFFTQMGVVRYEDSAGRLFAHPTFGTELLVGASQGYPTIMSAVSAANPGDRIKILNGTYTEDVTINKANLTIVGEGKGSIINGNVNFILGGNACYMTNIYFQKNITFASGTLYNELIGNWCATTTTITDGTVVTSTTYTYQTYAKNVAVFSYYASAATTYNTFAVYSADLPTKAYTSASASTFASATITTNTIAYTGLTLRTYASAATTFNAFARATRAADAFANAASTYQVKATGSRTYNVKATGATTYSVRASTSTTSSTYATAAGTFSTHAFSTYDGATFTATNLGTSGNSISLVFDGVQDIQTVVATWNGANGGNQVSFSGRPGTDVLIAGTANLFAGSAGNAVTYTANTAGVAGNSISLVFNGTATLNTVVTAWNGANPGNQVSQNGNPNGVPPAGTVNLAGATAGNAVTFTAVTAGTVGNGISLVFNGTDTIQTVVNTWNGANPANQVSFTGTASSIVAASTVSLSGGSAGNAATFTANTAGTTGNSISLVFNGTTDTLNSVTTTWNGANPGNQVTFTGTSSGVPVAGTVLLSGGVSTATSNFTANNLGLSGNSISLVFNGTTDTLTSVTTAWNGANPTNQVAFTGTGAGIPTAGTTTLAGGLGATAVTFQAVTAGVAGNSIALVFDGTATIQTVVANWNGINPTNTVSTTGPNSGVCPAGTVTLSGGSTGGSYTFIANTIGTGGNAISLVFTGTNSVASVVATWNGANPTNQVTLSVGTGTNVITAQTINLSGGATNSAVTFTADTLGTIGNAISLVFNGTDTIQTVVNNWNSANPGNTVNQNGNPLGFVAASTLNLSGGLAATTFEYCAVTPGTNGNSISLTFNGTTDTVASVMATWNAANPTNQVTTDVPALNGIPAAGTYTLTNGANAQTIVFTADNIGTSGNSISLTFTTGDTIGQVVAYWNIGSPTNSVNQNSAPAYMIPNQTINLSGGSAAGPFNFIAVNTGTNGNSISIVADGVKTIAQLQTAWNGANPGNTVTNNAASQAGVPIAGTYTLSGGTAATTISFQAANTGLAGNSISLVFNGTISISTEVTTWNTANPANQVVSPAGQSAVILAAQTINLTGGQTNAAITFTAVTAGTAGNSISLVFNGVQNVGTVVTNWNTANPSNTVSTTELSSGIVPARTITLTGGADTITYTFTAQNIGTIGNAISLVWTGLNTIDAVVNAWNIGNPTNKVSYTGGSGTFVPPNPLTVNLVGGLGPTVVTFTAASSGNGFTLVFDGVQTIATVVTNWNTLNPASPVTYVGRADGICPPGTVRLVVNSSNNLWIMMGD